MTNREELSKLIAENLTYYRRKAGLTQLRLADTLAYSDKSISKWERGEGIPDAITLKTLADFYGIKIDDFFQVKKVKATKQVETKKHWLILLLSVGLVWLVAILCFVLTRVIFHKFSYPWLCFIYALIPSSILPVIWSAIYHKRKYLLCSLTALIWTCCLSLFLSFYLFMDAPWAYLMFILGIPLEVLAVLFYGLRKTIRESKKTLD